MDTRQNTCDVQDVYQNAVDLHQKGEVKQAATLYAGILEQFPEAAEVHYNLGLALFELEQFSRAALSCKRAAELSPGDSDIWYNLGLACKMDHQYGAAEKAYLKALELEPDDRDILYNLGCCYQDSGAVEQACLVYDRVLQLAPNHLSALNNLAYLQHLQKNFARARELYGQVIKLDPDQRSAQHMFAALSGESKKEPPREYVRELFDQYSEHFEENLIQKLEYNTYKTLRQAFDGVAKKKSRYDHGLDLGCGTGLAGESFHAVCTKLTGVDLSAKMLEQAARKNLYHELHCADIIDFFEQTDQIFDLIIGADVLPYLGNLSPLFAALSGHTAKKNLFCLSSEITRKPQWELQRTGRFAHNSDYIIQTAEENGWAVLFQSTEKIRKENDIWIRGSIFVLGKKVSMKSNSASCDNDGFPRHA